MHDLQSLLDSLGTPRLLVLGDVMLDRFVWGEAERVSPEAAALVLRCQREDASLGGAGSVALLARSLGARVSIAGVVGEGDGGWLLRRLLHEAGIDQESLLHDVGRSTTVKQRFIGQAGNGPEQQLLRLDRESRVPLSASLQHQLRRLVEQQLKECDALLVADHGKGVCCPELLYDVLAEAQQLGVPVLVDPAREADFLIYQGATLLLPNRVEASRASRQRISTTEEAVAAARSLAEDLRVPGVLVKLDRDGMVLALRGAAERVYPACARVVRDVTGAGDMVLAVLGLGAACGVAWQQAVELASVAAGLEVALPGSAPLTRQDLLEWILPCRPSAGKVVSLERMTELAEGYRRQQRRVVLTNGCFDLLHAGHTAYLEEAASLGDVLVVAVNDDCSVRRLKGEGRPVIAEADRAALLGALACVDHVLLFAGDTPHEVLSRVRPAVLVKGGDYSVAEVVGREVVQGYGGTVVVTGKLDGLSTTKVLDAVRRHTA